MGPSQCHLRSLQRTQCPLPASSVCWSHAGDPGAGREDPSTPPPELLEVLPLLEPLPELLPELPPELPKLPASPGWTVCPPQAAEASAPRRRRQRCVARERRRPIP